MRQHRAVPRGDFSKGETTKRQRLPRSGWKRFKSGGAKFFPARARQTNIGAMGTGAQNCAAPGIPAKEEHVILRVAVMPERFVRGIEPEQFANAFVRFYFTVTGRAFR